MSKAAYQSKFISLKEAADLFGKPDDLLLALKEGAIQAEGRYSTDADYAEFADGNVALDEDDEEPTYPYALSNDLDLPIGTTDAGLLDTQSFDTDFDADAPDDDSGAMIEPDSAAPAQSKTEVNLRKRSQDLYKAYASLGKKRFKWLKASHFVKQLSKDLESDAAALMQCLNVLGQWRADQDAKLDALEKLLIDTHPDEKILIFSQFADTVEYLESELKKRGIQRIAGVTGDTLDPTTAAWRFSPRSNDKMALVKPEEELRVLIATDVLSEGQNRPVTTLASSPP